MLNLNINFSDYTTTIHVFKPKTLDNSDLKRVFDKCIGERVTLDYVWNNSVATYSCIIHDESCKDTFNGCSDGQESCNELQRTLQKLQEGCIRVTAFKSVQPKVATPHSITIPGNSVQLMQLFKNVCFETSEFYVYVSRKKGKVDISYCFKKHQTNHQNMRHAQQ